MNSPIKILYYGLETTGTDERKHGIHQMSGMLEIDGKVVETFDYRVQPNPKATLEPEALAVGRVTAEEVMAYEPMDKVYRRFTSMLQKYVDKFNTKDKIYLCGFNSADFDNRFLRAWFRQNGHYRKKKGKKGQEVFTQSRTEITVRAKFCPFSGLPLYKEVEE